MLVFKDPGVVDEAVQVLVNEEHRPAELAAVADVCVIVVTATRSGQRWSEDLHCHTRLKSAAIKVIMQVEQDFSRAQRGHSLVDSDLTRDLGPETRILHRYHLLLGVSIHVHVQHQLCRNPINLAKQCDHSMSHLHERGAKVGGQFGVGHALKNDGDRELLRHRLDGQVLTVQTHLTEEVELVPAQQYSQRSKRGSRRQGNQSMKNNGSETCPETPAGISSNTPDSLTPPTDNT